MPPKRKRTDDIAAEASSSTRTTRSTRSSTIAPTAAVTLPTPGITQKLIVQEIGEEQAKQTSPPAKKTKTTKASARSNQVGKKSKQAVEKDPTAPITGLADNSVSTTYTDDDVFARHRALPAESQGTPLPKSATAHTPSPPPPSINEPYTPKRSLALFGQYADSDDPNTIGPEGFEKLCTDANMPLDGALPLILAWQLNAKEMGKISIDEWKMGTELLKVSSLHALTLAVRDLENILILNKTPPAKKQKESYDKTTFWKYCENKKAAFQKLYLFCFLLAKPEQSRNIDMETATALWSVLLVPKYPLMTEVINFINDKGSYKAANKDLWSMMLEFCETVNPNLSDYEGDGAWPTLLDDFVLWTKGPPVEDNAVTN